jgi:hypothetical protein
MRHLPVCILLKRFYIDLFLDSVDFRENYKKIIFNDENQLLTREVVNVLG